MAVLYRAPGPSYPRRRMLFAQEPGRTARGPPACYVAGKALLEDNNSLPRIGVGQSASEHRKGLFPVHEM